MSINFLHRFFVARRARQALGIFSIVFAIAACSKGGDEPSPPVVPLTYAFTPSGLAARAQDSIITLGWPQASGATNYNLYWSLTPGVTKSTGTKIATGNTLEFAHTKLTNTVPYYYVYTVETAAGESFASPELALAPSSTVTGPPPNVYIMGMDGHVEVFWDGEVPGATAYNIYWKASPGVSKADAKISDVTSPAVLPGLENNKAYYVAVTAVIDGDEKALSDEVAAIPFAPYPLVVTPGALPQTPRLVYVYAGNEQATLWAEDSTDTLRYHIYWNISGAEVTTADAKISDVLLPFTQTGLTNLTDGKRYNYRVAAVNEHGESALSAQVSITPNNDKISALVVTDSVLNTCINDMAMMYGWSYVRQVEHLMCKTDDVVKNNVVNITGIEKLSNLYHLNLSNVNTLKTGIDEISKLTNLSYLELNGTGINNISFVAGLTNLIDLRIEDNYISDLTPLTDLVYLTMLTVYNNLIANVGPLAKLTELDELWMQNNFVVNVLPLAGLTQLTTLVLSNNKIVNVGPIKNLTGLISLKLENNLIGGLDVGNIETLAALRNPAEILLVGNPTMSCAALEVLINKFNFPTKSVVSPPKAIPTPMLNANCTG